MLSSLSLFPSIHARSSHPSPPLAALLLSSIASPSPCFSRLLLFSSCSTLGHIKQHQGLLQQHQNGFKGSDSGELDSCFGAQGLVSARRNSRHNSQRLPLLECYFVLLSWMPLYFKTVFDMNLKQAAWFGAIPWGMMAVSSYIAGVASYKLTKAGYSIATIRKIVQDSCFRAVIATVPLPFN